MSAEAKIDHKDMVKTLVKPGADIVASLTPEKADLWHAATGIAGEGGELLDAFLQTHLNTEPLDRANVVEELGDLEFYIEQLRQNTGLTQDVQGIIDTVALLGKRNVQVYASLVAIHASTILDTVKKSAIYNKALDLVKLAADVVYLEAAMWLVRHECEITREETIEGNIAKLGERYKGFKYSDQAAQDRADKAANG